MILIDKFCIYLNYFTSFPHVPFTILHRKSFHYQGMTVTGIGPFSTLHDQNKRYHESRVLTWIGDLNLAEEKSFLSAC